MSPNDEFADFEIWERGNLNLMPKKPGGLETECARDALKNGRAIEQKLAANPFKIGLFNVFSGQILFNDRLRLSPGSLAVNL